MCTIVESRLAAQSPTDPGGETLYRPEVRYRYRVGPSDFESTRYRFVNAFRNDESGAAAAVRAYPAGATVSCFVDPADPSEAVLDRGFSPLTAVILLPAAFVALGIWSLALVARDRGRVR